MDSQKINLRNVTLCAVDCINPVLASRALDISKRGCLFGDSVLLTDKRVESNSRIALIPAIGSREEYSAFILKHLLRHVSTPWVLLIQWDGFVVNPSAWTEDFFSCDYIGARWPFHHDGMSVGNGGFSLRSRRLLEILATDERFPPHPQIVEDELICRTYRPLLEREFGIRFADEQLADRFSLEFTRASQPPFGFHAVFNMNRFVEDADIIFFAENAHMRSVQTTDFLDLCLSCRKEGRTSVTRALYSRVRSRFSPEQIAQTYTRDLFQLTAEEAAEHVAACEALLADSQ
ncbi:DUF5672 family protein [Caballeronia sp. LZ019]|uniref:DUF5672 family protein n=1 Tax=Caballeronia sp. LZ019 TaxID=3038555 RepID=UPI00285D9185|nr:DUF5672 family protein [Caballeronia sp. LZ019]MDR5809447.1 DUF5672 family protein [Caballeronia sp. LZ019]